MAITKTYINDDFSIFEQFLTASGLFDSVEHEARTVTCKDADENTLLSFAVASNTMTITAYASDSDNKAVQYPYGSTSHQMLLTYGYACTNGVMLQFKGQNYEACCLIARTNNGDIVIIMSDSSSVTQRKQFTDSIWCVAWGDVAPFSNFTFTAHERNQTVIAPFATCSDIGDVSYTDKAGYMPFGQYYNSGYGTLNIDGVEWLTNGYWAIKDGAAE